jgi:hypothetical protein
MSKMVVSHASRQIALLTKAIRCEDPEAVRLLVQRAFDVVNTTGDTIAYGKNIPDAEIDVITSLIMGVNPQDSVEMVLACQFISTHLQGSVHLANDNTSHGMMLLRLSHQSLDMLQKYRSKGSNINVNYFIKNEGQALIQTNMGKNLKKKGE